MALLVNGEHVSDQEIDLVRRQIAMEQIEPPATLDGDKADLDSMAREAVIARVLVKQEALRRDLPVPQEDIDKDVNEAMEECGGEEEFEKRLEEAGVTRDDFVKDITLRHKVDRLLDEVCKEVVEPSDSDARACYEANKNHFAIPERIRVSHIVRHVQGNIVEMHAASEEMNEMLRQIRNGTPFEKLASQNSDCPDNAGDLGYFARGAMVQEFEDVVFALEKSEVSNVFQTPFGLHIAKLYDRIPAKVRPFEDVAGEVKEHLSKERENAVIDEFTLSLRKVASVEEVEEATAEA
jgi:parvulin-like peptidyl-prolyl isomerase